MMNINKSQPIFLLFFYILFVSLWSLISVCSEPRKFRQRNVISKVDEHSNLLTFEMIHENYEFMKFSEILKSMPEPPFIIFYDTSNINVTLNHICNLEFMPSVLSRLAAVSFDTRSHHILTEKYPQIASVVVDLDPLKESIAAHIQNRNYIIYQLVLLTRARICASLAHRNINFWAMQQDTIWIENFAAMNIEKRYPDALMLFDTVGNEFHSEYNRMKGWICGSTFYVKGSPLTVQFFKEVEAMMRTRQSPDSSVMTYLCGHQQYKCERLPRWVISSSNYFRGPRTNVPVMIQVDSDQTKVSKMELFSKAKFIFQNKDGTCDQRAVIRLRDNVRNALPEALKDDKYTETTLKRIYYTLKNIFNVDPNNNKYFLRVHEILI